MQLRLQDRKHLSAQHHGQCALGPTMGLMRVHGHRTGVAGAVSRLQSTLRPLCHTVSYLCALILQTLSYPVERRKHDSLLAFYFHIRFLQYLSTWHDTGVAVQIESCQTTCIPST